MSEPGRPLRLAVDLRPLAADDRGGVARFIRRVVGELAGRAGWSVVGLSPDPAAVGDVGVDVHRLPGGREAVREQLALPRELARLGADVLLSPGNRGLPLVSPCPAVLVVYDATEWDLAMVGRPHRAAAVRFAYAGAISLARAARIVTISDYAAAVIAERLGIADTRIRVARCGVEPRFFLTELDDEAVGHAAERHGIVPGAVLSVGALRPHKDQETLVRAVALLPADVAPRLVLAGRGPEEPHLRRLAAELGVAERVVFPGFVDDPELPALYRAAAVVAVPSRSEGFGLPALEAMAAGAPLVAARAGALPEIAGDAALLVPPGDPEALAVAIASIRSSPGPAAARVALGRERAASFTWVRTADAVEAALREAIGLGPGRAAREELSSLRALGRWVRPR